MRTSKTFYTRNHETTSVSFQTQKDKAMSESYAAQLGVGAFIFALIAAFAALIQLGNLKEEAIKRGFAEWHVLGQDSTEFRWKETKL